MPATPVYALPYPAASDPADVPLDMQELAERVALVLGGALSPTPPSSPFEGQLWAMSPAAGVVWVFRYNAASASPYKWELAGGPTLGAETVLEATTASAAYVAFGPSVTVTRPGEYEIDLWGSHRFDGGWGGFLTPKLGAAAPQDTDAIRGVWAAAGTDSVGQSYARKLPSRTMSAAGDIALWGKTNGGATARWANRGLAVRPLRVS